MPLFRTAIVLAWCTVVTPCLFAVQPWDEPFSSSSADILKSAIAIPTPETSDVVVLLDEQKYNIEKDGKTTTTLRKVYRICKQSGVEDWSSIEKEYAPWYENKPELRARVITKAGEMFWLDPKTIADAPASQLDSTIFSDDRIIRAPLPAVGEGSVIEYQLVIKETAPLFVGGISRELIVGSGLPVERFHAVVDAAKGIPLRIGTSLIPTAAVVRTESKMGIHVDCELGRQEVSDHFEFSTPSDVAIFPSFRFSTGVSWQQVATLYEQIVAEQIHGADLTSLLPVGKPTGDAKHVAAAMTAVLHQQVRYTGVEFAQAAIVPRKPAEVLARRYGDCKDKAALLVALLRSVGLDAHVALLNAGDTQDVDLNLPGFGLFNHAIVYVGGQEPFWIDATAPEARVGTLPIMDQGRRALVADRTTTGLIVTPESTSKDNRIIHTVEIHMNESGRNGTIRGTAEAYGSFEQQLRSTYGGDDKQIRKALEQYVKSTFMAKTLADFSVVKRTDFSQPFHVTAETRDSGAAVTGLQDAAVALSNGLLFQSLPFAFTLDLAQEDSAEKPRKYDFVFHEPYRSEVHFKIYPPASFSPKRLPPSEKTMIVDAFYSLESKTNPDGTVELDYVFDTGKRRWTPAEFTNLRAELKKRIRSGVEAIEFSYQAANLVALGKTGEALLMVSHDAAQHPKDALPQMRLSQLLINAGAGKAGLESAQRAVSIDPQSAQVWQTLAVAYEHDSFGRLRTGDWNPKEAEKALRKAIELDKDDQTSLIELAILLEFNASGERYGKGARLAEACDLYRQSLKKSPNAIVSQNLTIALIQSEHYREARDELKNIQTSPAYPEMSIALEALIDGPERAIIDSQSSYADASMRATNLLNAATTLNQIRQYGKANELFKAAQRFSNAPEIAQRAIYFGRVKRSEELFSTANDPRFPVQRFIAFIWADQSNPDDLKSILSKGEDVAFWENKLTIARRSFSTARAYLRSGNASSSLMRDLMLSMTKIDTFGEAGEIRKVSVVSDLGAGLFPFFVIKEDEQYKLLATADSLGTIGKRVLGMLAKNDLKSAQSWLDAMKDAALPELREDDKGPAFRYLWAGVAPETRNAEFARVAAASLLGTYSGSEEAIQILRTAASHPPQYMERDDLTFAICEALKRAGKWEELLRTAQTFSKNKLYVNSVYFFSSEARMHLHQWKLLRTDADARLQVNRNDRQAIRCAVVASFYLKEFDKASEYLQKIPEMGITSNPQDRLLVGWSAILRNNATDQTVSTLEGEGRSLFQQNSEYLYTLALAQIFAGKVEDAERNLNLALDRDDSRPATRMPWLVQAEMMKRYGLSDIAATDFIQAKSAQNDTAFELSDLLLNQQK